MIGARFGTWVITEELGQGGMGHVYLARSVNGGTPEAPPRQAALKVLEPGLASNPGFVNRFQREIDILRQLDHPNIVHFLEAGSQDGRFYYVMEYVPGPNLEEVLRQRGRLPWDEVLDVALQVSLALKHAHDRGVVHRDLKPSNLLLQRDADSEAPAGSGALGGVVKLTDFGIARVFDGPQLTSTGGVVGTAEFLSPEQAAGKPATKRSDLYSLGVVLYVLLTGRPPFEGEGFVDLLHKHRYAQFERAARLVPDLPHDLDDLICQLLEKSPAQRPADAGVLHRQLDSIRRKLDFKARQAEGAAAPGLSTGRTPRLPNSPPRAADAGSAALMSQLMRRELERQQRGGPLRRFFNRPWVVVALFLLTLGLIVWALWPANPEGQFQRGAALMRSDNPDDWERGWNDYLEPLQRKDPGNPHHEEIDRFRQQVEDYRAQRAATRRAKSDRPLSEAQWFYEEGLRLRQRGDSAGAERLWRNLAASFRDVPSEQVWVRLAEQQLQQPADRLLSAEERWAPVRSALEHARRLRDDKRPEAEAIWKGVEELYRDDPSAAGILEEVRKDRGH